jgi:hypothetical protein
MQTYLPARSSSAPTDHRDTATRRSRRRSHGTRGGARTTPRGHGSSVWSVATRPARSQRAPSRTTRPNGLAAPDRARGDDTRGSSASSPLRGSSGPDHVRCFLGFQARPRDDDAGTGSGAIRTRRNAGCSTGPYDGRDRSREIDRRRPSFGGGWARGLRLRWAWSIPRRRALTGRGDCGGPLESRTWLLTFRGAMTSGAATLRAAGRKWSATNPDRSRARSLRRGRRERAGMPRCAVPTTPRRSRAWTLPS